MKKFLTILLTLILFILPLTVSAQKGAYPEDQTTSIAAEAKNRFYDSRRRGCDSARGSVARKRKRISCETRRSGACGL